MQSYFADLVQRSNSLGSNISGLRLDSGSIGRGLFRTTSHQFSCSVPRSLFINIDNVRMVDSVLQYKPDVNLFSFDQCGQTDNHVDLLSEYLNAFIFNSAELQKWHHLWTLLNNPIHKKLRESMVAMGINQFPENNSSSFSDHDALRMFLKSRAFSVDGELFTAPFWDMINHSPNALGLRLTPSHVSAPAASLDGSSRELLQRYSLTISGLGMWMTHLFSSKEYYVYSFPLTIFIPEISKKLVISGAQNLDCQVKAKQNSNGDLELFAFPLVSPSVDFSLRYLAQYLSNHCSLASLKKVYRKILHQNIDVRKKLLDLCIPLDNPSLQELCVVVHHEVQLIKSQLLQLDASI